MVTQKSRSRVARAYVAMASVGLAFALPLADAEFAAAAKRPMAGSKSMHKSSAIAFRFDSKRVGRGSIRARRAALPSLKLSTLSGLPGSSLKVSGSGYPRRARGTVELGGVRVANVKTSRTGTFSSSVVVPLGVGPGATSVRGLVATVTATSAFTVLAPASAPEPTPVATPTPTPTPTPTITPTPTATPTHDAKAITRAVGSAVLSDADAAARVRRSTWEPRLANWDPNHRVPTSAEISTFLTQSGGWGTCGDRFRTRVTGNFTGTTDEIIQWAAHKWGIDEDLARAQAVKESWWYMSTAGDGGISYGLMQIKSTFNPGTAPLSYQSTAFNLDYWGALMRNHYDGCSTWLNTVERGSEYVAGDIWGAVGTWYAGRWHTAAAESYITAVKDHLARRTWAGSGF